MQDGVRSPSPGRYEPLLVHPDAGAALSELLRRSAADLLLVSPRAVSGSQPASPPTSAPASAAVASAAAAAPTPPKPPPPVAADATARRAERRDRPSNPRRCGSLRHDLLRQSEALALSIDSHSNAIASMEATLAMRSAEASELARQVKEGRRAVAGLRAEVAEYKRTCATRRGSAATAESVAAAKVQRLSAERRAAAAEAEAESTAQRCAEEAAAAQAQARQARREFDVRRAEILGEHEEKLAAGKDAMAAKMHETCQTMRERLADEAARLRGRADFLERQVERKQELVDRLAGQHADLEHRAAAVLELHVRSATACGTEWERERRRQLRRAAAATCTERRRQREAGYDRVRRRLIASPSAPHRAHSITSWSARPASRRHPSSTSAG
eukprot:TRINITY_DN20817_c0_g1_i2.p1 TRINITY_DN20817_c0_g1~~TRINITY_DN20817_c0_g1_i2.p1  ORF type:complete len:407 (+),score=125.46 TRINITY_DN20817_c0_g1_i2:59-1222(+)